MKKIICMSLFSVVIVFLVFVRFIKTSDPNASIVESCIQLVKNLKEVMNSRSVMEVCKDQGDENSQLLLTVLNGEKMPHSVIYGSATEAGYEEWESSDRQLIIQYIDAINHLEITQETASDEYYYVCDYTDMIIFTMDSGERCGLELNEGDNWIANQIKVYHVENVGEVRGLNQKLKEQSTSDE